MGNSPISIVVRTEKFQYCAGEAVNGKVYVNVNTSSGQPVRGISLRILGRENAVVHYTTSESRRDTDNREHTHHRDHYDECSNEFLLMEYPLHTFPTGQVPRGQYEFPFCIPFPSNLPSSMNCNRGESKCSVEYKLTATIQGSSNGIFSSAPSSEQNLTIIAVPPSTDNLVDTSLRLPMDEIPVTACCCRGKGTIALQANFSKTVVQVHDDIDIQFRCQNYSTARVKQVRAELQSIVNWQGHRGDRKESVTKVLDHREINASQFPELEKRSRKGFGYEQEPFQDQSDWRNISVRVPATVMDSFDGRYIQVRHILSITLRTEGCCTTDPDATTQLQVYQRLPPSANTAMGDSITSEASVSPSAPSSLYDYNAPTAEASAPPSWEDEGGIATTMGSPLATTASTKVHVSAPMAEAQALPPDWNAQTADVVMIPMADAIVLD